MKIKYLIFIILVFAASSCQKFLTEDQQGVYSSATFYKTQGEALMAINSAYNDLLFNSSDNCIWVFGDVASDDAVKAAWLATNWIYNILISSVWYLLI